VLTVLVWPRHDLVEEKGARSFCAESLVEIVVTCLRFMFAIISGKFNGDIEAVCSLGQNS
jgi:hypothetical protein